MEKSPLWKARSNQKAAGQGPLINFGPSSSSRSEPRIADLVAGSWAQRSDVLCVGDVIVSVNGIDASALTHSGLVQTLDESDRCVAIGCFNFVAQSR